MRRDVNDRESALTNVNSSELEVQCRLCEADGHEMCTLRTRFLPLSELFESVARQRVHTSDLCKHWRGTRHLAGGGQEIQQTLRCRKEHL